MARPCDVWKRWKEESTIIGVNRISAGHSAENFVWVTMIIVSICAVSFQTTNVVTRYFAYEVKTTTKLTVDEAIFPAVTVCSMNPYKTSEMAKLPEFDDMVEFLNLSPELTKGTKYGSLETKQPVQEDTTETMNVVVSTYCDCVRKHHGWVCEADQLSESENPFACACIMKESWNCIRCPSNQTCHFKYQAVIDPKFGDYGLSVNESKMANQVRMMENIPFIANTLPNAEYRNMTYDFDDLVLGCLFGIKTCNSSHFTEHERTGWGRCYSFNYHEPSNFNVSRRGPDYALNLLLFSDPTLYVPFTDSVGVRIVLHEQETFPFSTSFGYDATTGKQTTLALRSVRTHRLNVEDSHCRQPDDVEGIQYPGKYTVELATVQGCQRAGIQNLSWKACGCADARYSLTNPNQTYCNVSDQEQRNCLLSLTDRDDYVFDCPSPCLETQFATTISQADLRMNSFLEHYTSVSENLTVEHFALVRIYFDDTVMENFVEELSYTLATFMSDVGAIIGFWMGLSVIAVFEISIFVVDMASALTEYSCLLGNHLYVNRSIQKTLPERRVHSAGSVRSALDNRIVPVDRDWDPRIGGYLSQKGLTKKRRENYRGLATIFGVKVEKRHRMRNTRMPI